MDLIGNPSVAFFALLQKLQDNVLLNNLILKQLWTQIFLEFHRAYQEVEKLQTDLENFDYLFAAG